MITPINVLWFKWYLHWHIEKWEMNISKYSPHGCIKKHLLNKDQIALISAFSHVGGSFNLFLATTGDVWIIPSFRIWDYVLHVEHVSCVITNCGQHQWVIPSPLSIALQALLGENTTRKLLSQSLDLIFKILLFHVTFLIFFSIAIFSPYFLQVGLLLQCVTQFQSGM